MIPQRKSVPFKPNDTLGEQPRKFRLKLVGIGGAGGNAIQAITAARDAGQVNLQGVELLAINTDLQALHATSGVDRLQIGAALTHGLGAGGDPEIGTRAAQQDMERIEAALEHADVVFLAAGLGGGTGTGASPVVARKAKEQGALVLAFVALPFSFEGKRRCDQAAIGLEELKSAADAVICIPNDRLFKVLGPDVAVTTAFERANRIIGSGVQAVWQLLSRQGLINLDFADLRSTLGGRHGEGLFSHGESQGPDRIHDAVKQLLENPLFDANETLVRAEGVLVSVLGGPDLTITDVQRVVEPISKLAQRAQVIMGAAIDSAYQERVAVTVIASGKRPAASRTPARPTPTEPRLQPKPPEEISLTDPVPTKPNKTPKQEELGLETLSRGRFTDAEPTLHNGEDLDVPTFVRRGIRLQ